MEIQNQNTVIVYTYRYLWKDKSGKLRAKYLTDTNENHAKFQKAILDDSDIVSCMREYIGEINYAFIGFSEEVKKENKKEIENEKV